MCLTIDKQFQTEGEAKAFANKPLIAKKDILVYKALHISNGKTFTPYEFFPMEEGFEYYQDDKKLSTSVRLSLGKWKVTVGAGLHSCKSAMSASGKYRCDKVVEMIIPKGAKYFEGKNNDYVSTRLIWPHGKQTRVRKLQKQTRQLVS